MEVNLTELASFLEKANQHTYAADGQKSQSTRLKSEDFDFRDGDWLYHDTYFGNENFIGGEVIYKKEVPIWGANYYGYIIDINASPKEVYGFLKKALMQKYNNIIPVRGPAHYSEENFEYLNKVEGDLKNFIGEETITKNRKLLYKAFYHGGLIIGSE